MSTDSLTARTRAALATPPLSQMNGAQRDELLAALADADEFEDLPGKWQAAILAAELAAPPKRHCCGG